MDAKKLTGPNAGSLKYDLLTALGAWGLQNSPRVQVSAMRLMTLVTARYNWRLDELSVGQRDMARMFGVTERTVKREVKYWCDAQILICKRQGVRGRVGAYRLNYPEIFRMTSEMWDSVGPDFSQRMSEGSPMAAAEQTVVPVDFRKKEAVVPGPVQKGTWGAVCERIRGMNPDRFEAWIAPLVLLDDSGGVLVLQAPTRFAAQYVETHLSSVIYEAVEACMGPRQRIVLQSGQ